MIDVALSGSRSVYANLLSHDRVANGVLYPAAEARAARDKRMKFPSLAARVHMIGQRIEQCLIKFAPDESRVELLGIDTHGQAAVLSATPAEQNAWRARHAPAGRNFASVKSG